MSFTFVVDIPGNHTYCMVAFGPLTVSIVIEKGASAHDIEEIPNK